LLIGASIGLLNDPVIRDVVVFVAAAWGQAKIYAAWRDRQGRVQAIILVAAAWYLTWVCISAAHAR
jgi:hypothetical protein